jgi:hypothetical protein
MSFVLNYYNPFADTNCEGIKQFCHVGIYHVNRPVMAGFRIVPSGQGLTFSPWGIIPTLVVHLSGGMTFFSLGCVRARCFWEYGVWGVFAIFIHEGNFYCVRMHLPVLARKCSWCLMFRSTTSSKVLWLTPRQVAFSIVLRASSVQQLYIHKQTAKQMHELVSFGNFHFRNVLSKGEKTLVMVPTCHDIIRAKLSICTFPMFY